MTNEALTIATPLSLGPSRVEMILSQVKLSDSGKALKSPQFIMKPAITEQTFLLFKKGIRVPLAPLQIASL